LSLRFLFLIVFFVPRDAHKFSLSQLTVDAGEPNSWVEGVAILAAVAVCVLVTAVNNYQKERQFRELNDVKEDVRVRVVRQGRVREVSCHELLVGDVVVVSYRLFFCFSL
jgi:P-type Ca2+ transporter type 2B